MGLMGWWRPFKQEDVAFLKELIESRCRAREYRVDQPRVRRRLSQVATAWTLLEFGSHGATRPSTCCATCRLKSSGLLNPFTC